MTPLTIARCSRRSNCRAWGRYDCAWVSLSGLVVGALVVLGCVVAGHPSRASILYRHQNIPNPSGAAQRGFISARRWSNTPSAARLCPCCVTSIPLAPTSRNCGLTDSQNPAAVIGSGHGFFGSSAVCPTRDIRRYKRATRTVPTSDGWSISSTVLGAASDEWMPMTLTVVVPSQALLTIRTCRVQFAVAGVILEVGDDSERASQRRHVPRERRQFRSGHRAALDRRHAGLRHTK